MGIKVKSLDPKSVLSKFSVQIHTTASIGPAFVMVPFDGMFESVFTEHAIAITSNRQITVRNLTKSMTYLNSQVITTVTACHGNAYAVDISSSRMYSSTNHSSVAVDPWVSAGTVLLVNWTASKGDAAYSLMFRRANQ